MHAYYSSSYSRYIKPSALIVLFHFGLFPVGLFEQLFVGVWLLEFSSGLFLRHFFCLRGGDRENVFLSSRV
jgi:hypothetical protein